MIDALRSRINNKLDQLLLHGSDRLDQAMRYAVVGSGKRLRPILCYLSGLSCGAKLEQMDSAATALELVHCYSLVHDDLPAMDDDDLRRGNPTCHIQFDEATAVLAGDALQSLAFQAIAQDESLTPEARIRLVEILAQAIGHQGMCLGQSLDMQNENNFTGTLDTLKQIHVHKTGMLITACTQMGAIIAGHDGDDIFMRLTEYGNMIGHGFQIRDDVLDVEASTETLGKPQGSDIKNKKMTYLRYHSVDTLKNLLIEIEEKALKIIEALPEKFDALSTLTTFMLKRPF